MTCAIVPLEQHLAVNLFGSYGVTQAFLPLLTRSRGAIVNNVSMMAMAPIPINSGLANLKGGRIQLDPIAARASVRARRAGVPKALEHEYAPLVQMRAA